MTKAIRSENFRVRLTETIHKALWITLLVSVGYSGVSQAQTCQRALEVEEVRIALASETDFVGIIKIANQHRAELGQVLKHNLRVGLKESSLMVAKIEGAIVVGFVLWHQRKDGWHTIYDLAVDREYLRLGIGAALINKVPRPRQLKATAGNERALNFYERVGLIQVGETLSRTGRRLLILRDPR